MSPGPDAVVVGAGHNGLVAAVLLADAGWDVVVLEEQDRIGGAVYSDRSLHPDYVTDWYSAFYPLGAASPVLGALDLHEYGLSWAHAPAALAHVLPDDRCAVLFRDPAETAESVETFAAGDGDAWLSLVAQFERIREPLLRALFTPFPPVRGALGLARRLGAADLLRLARFAVTPIRRAGEELFSGEGGTLLLAGNALHTDLPPEAAGSALFGWMLAMLGQSYGFPVPVGGSGGIIDALAGRLRAAGGSIRTGARVERVELAGTAVRGVALADGETLDTEVVLADVSAPALYSQLVGPQHLPPRLVTDLERFQWDSPTIKVNWALSAPIPWRAPGARGAGTVHLGVDLDGLTRYAASLAVRELPPDPFVLLGQMTTADATRSPAGTESAWAYTHVPEGLQLTAELCQQQVDRVEHVIETHAPGFRNQVVARSIQTPGDLEDGNANLVHGAVNGGTAGIHQQLVFRPVPGLARAETPFDGLYLASSSAHPGGGVHGGPGANAARAALARRRWSGRARRRLLDSAFSRIYC